MNKNSEQTAPLLPMMLSVLVGSLLALIFAVIILLSASVAVSRGLFPESLGKQIVIFASLISALIGGAYAKRKWGRRKLIAGILTGTMFFLLQAAIGLLVYSNCEIAQSGIGNLIGCICGGTAAGLVTPRKGKRAKHRK